MTKPLTNVQVELLNTFAYQLPDDELQELKQTLTLFFARRIRKRTDAIWNEKGYTSETMNNWLNEENQ
ncbi:hypothetical protein VB796_19405 [Arcicella sp. LKC2W]|jgi:hypothetical protein|uniref:hypothetical protein n=1 Tax=Arcicella sp. LKC2W TaxID=2984198 RepID=UPI002B20EDAE|nr:hypothetical protein [Arcicella sp. LKC2W]MEA5461239.1 hypothetical protein [Arcicella sp. LKC2W]